MIPKRTEELKTMLNARLFALVAVSLALVTGPALAQTARELGQFRDWGAYVAEQDGTKTCFVLSQPKDEEPKNVRHGEVFFYITSRPAQGVQNEVSLIAGYPFRDGSEVTAQIGSDIFALFTDQDGAWLDNAAENARLIAAMRAGQSMIVKGTSTRGTNTTYRYSLFGISAALDRMAQECG